MSRWDTDIDNLARAVAQLLVVAPTTQTAPLADPGAAVAARNAVIAEVRTLIGAVNHSRHRPATAITAGDLVMQPVAALVAALRQLPDAPAAADSAGVSPPTAAATPVERLWHDAARACVCLEAYLDALGRLPEDTGWAVLRDLVDLASALPDLDADLAASLPPGHPALAALGTGRSHEVVRLAAREATARVQARMAEAKPQAIALAACGQRPALRPPRHVHDLPAATRQLAAVVNHRGENVTMDEIRAVIRLLRGGLDNVAAILERPSPAPAAWTDAAAAIRTALPALEDLRRARAATLTPTNMTVVAAARDIGAKLDALAALAHRLPRTAATEQWQRIVEPAVTWARAAPTLLAAVDTAQRAAMEHRSLFVPTESHDFESHGLRWEPARPGWPHADDVLRRVSVARQALNAASGPLAPGPPPAGPFRGARVDGSQARHPRDDLRGALAARNSVTAPRVRLAPANLGGVRPRRPAQRR